MAPFSGPVVKAYNQLLAEQKQHGAINVSTRLFSTTIHEVSRLTYGNYEPDGGTALFDSLVSTIDATQAATPASVSVVIVIISDGEDNESKTSTAACKARIMDRLAAGWRFIFVGANQDAIKVATDLGIEPECALTFAASAKGVGQAMRAVSETLIAYRSGRQLVFRDQHRATHKLLLRECNPE